MNSKTYVNPEIIIYGRPIDDFHWYDTIAEVTIPKKIQFKFNELIGIKAKKVLWDFGDNTKIQVITDRKEDPLYADVDHVYRPKNIENNVTLNVSASVYTESDILIANQFKILNIQHHKVVNYVEPAVFEQQICTSYKTGHIPDDLAISIQQIATRLSFSSNFINYCVDSETEALTQRGWVNYKEINNKDIILSYNIETKHLTWSTIKDIYINENYNGPMHYLTTKGLDALVTPGHKFISKETGIKAVEHIKCGEHIILNGLPIKDDKIDTCWDNDFVELVGWAITEGNYLIGVNTNEVTIFQKVGEKCNQIRDCLKRLNATFKEYYWNKDKTIIGFRVIKLYANKIIQVAPHKILNSEFINELTYNQKMLLIKTMIKGDGNFRKLNDNLTAWSYVQKDKLHIDSFLMLCTLAGLTTTCRLVKNTSKFSKNPFYCVHIYSKPKYYCKSNCINMHGGRPNPGGDQIASSKKGKIENPNIPTHQYAGTVWCPTTEYGTFVCRRNGTIYVTGNSYREEMVGDAIIKMVKALRDRKFDPKRGNPFSYFTKIAYHAFCKRIKDEKREKETISSYQTEVYNSLVGTHFAPNETEEYETY